MLTLFIHGPYTRAFFCPFSKNSRPPSKKTQANFGQKLNVMEATLNIKKKTQKVLTKISRIYSKVLGIFNKFVEFSKYWINFCGIFPKIHNEFFKKIYEFLKISRNFPKKVKDLKKTQSYGGNVPQVASQKLGKKPPWVIVC